jgi:DNA-binding transcriptional MocR family regulator
MSILTGIKLQPAGDEPLYRQLFDQIVSRIRTGTFPAGYRLPPTRELACELATHRNTVVRAFEELEAAGFVSATVGRGTFVMSPAESAAGARAGQGLGSPAAPLPWDALVSNAVRTEAFVRAQSLLHTVANPEVIQLNRMQPADELLPAELVQRCFDHVMRSRGASALGYSAREGLPALRALIAEDLARQGVPAQASDLLVTTGSQQGLDLIARVLVNRGDAVLVDESTYHGAVGIFSSLGAHLVGVPADAEGPDMTALMRLTRAGAKALYLMPGCQNPTGARISLARRQALVSWSHDAGVPLIEDDYASDLNFDDPVVPALRTLDSEVIYLGSYSKKLVPALRVGYLLSPRGLLARFAALKYTMDLGTSLILQHTLAEFLERGYLPAHLTAVLPQYRKRRDILARALRRALPPSVTWHTPQSGLAMWIPTPETMDPEALCREAHRQGVLVSPGTLNGVTAAGQRGIRLSYSAESLTRLEEGGRRLGRAWTALSKTWPDRQAGERIEMV